MEEIYFWLRGRERTSCQLTQISSSLSQIDIKGSHSFLNEFSNCGAI